MRSEAFRYFSDQPLALAAFIIFLVTFIAIYVWTFHKSRKQHYEEMSQMPFRENKHE